VPLLSCPTVCSLLLLLLYTSGQINDEVELAQPSLVVNVAHWWCRWPVNCAGKEVWCGQDVKELPCYQLAALQSNMFASYTGPDSGLVLIRDIEQQARGTTG